MAIADVRRNEAGHRDSRRFTAETVPGGMARPAARAAARARDPQREVRDQPHRPRSWRDIERAMNRARDLRSRHCAALFAASFRRLWQFVVPRRAFASERAKAAVGTLILAGSVALAGFAVSSQTAFAQEKIAVATRVPAPDAATDRARLAELGISITAIEQCEDADLLWRAVRELVLPQRVSMAIQQRILRRVWVVDPDIAKGSLLNSETH